MRQTDKFAVCWRNPQTGEFGVTATTTRYDLATDLASRCQGYADLHRNGRSYYVTSEADASAIAAAYGSPFVISAEGTEAHADPAAAEAAEGTEAHAEPAECTTTARLIADLENAITLIRSSKATYTQSASHMESETGKEYMLRAASATLAHAACILREKAAQIDHCASTIEDQAESAKAARQRAKRQQPRIF